MMSERLRTDAIIGPRVRRELTAHRQTLLYELAYLRAFNQWEVFLDAVCQRYLCGYKFMGHQENPLARFTSNLSAAETALYGGRPFALWHNPQEVIRRANAHFAPGNRIANVLGSALADLTNFAAIRHRIAHDHEDARVRFDAACMRLAARHFPGSRPGAFLRLRTVRGAPPVPLSWLERICGDLGALSAQLAP